MVCCGLTVDFTMFFGMSISATTPFLLQNVDCSRFFVNATLHLRDKSSTDAKMGLNKKIDS